MQFLWGTLHLPSSAYNTRYGIELNRRTYIELGGKTWSNCAFIFLKKTEQTKSAFEKLLLGASIYHSQVHAGGLVNNGKGSNAYLWESNHIYAILVGLFSAITGGISYCLIRAGAKASDQPM